jgi:hypothetical protein
MLDVALNFLVKKFNAYLKARIDLSSMSGIEVAELSRLVGDDGKWAVGSGHIGVSLINVEEERVLREQVPELAYINGRHVVLPPPLKLNLHVLFAANFSRYADSLKYLSHVLTCFQAQRSFTQTEHADLDPRIEKLTVELLSLPYDQLNQIWAFVGAKQLPSAVYRVRMVLLQDAASDLAMPLTHLEAELHRT